MQMGYNCQNPFEPASRATIKMGVECTEIFYINIISTNLKNCMERHGNLKNGIALYFFFSLLITF